MSLVKGFLSFVFVSSLLPFSDSSLKNLKCLVSFCRTVVVSQHTDPTFESPKSSKKQLGIQVLYKLSLKKH